MVIYLKNELNDMITKERIIGAVMGGVFLATLAGAWFLPQPYSHYAGIICMIWCAAIVGFSCSIESKKSKIKLLKNVVIASVIISAFAMYYEGKPSDGFKTWTDPRGGDSDYQAYDGFDVICKQRVVSGVCLFLKIIFGSALGVQAAFLLRAKDGKRTA